LVISLSFSLSFAAGHTESLYREKCAQCHGRNGEGKTSVKAPSLISTEPKNMSDEQIRNFIIGRANGEMEKQGSHASLKKRLTTAQISQLIVEIRQLQEKHH
jgi:mono/diheme cytochrome c family protein